MQNTVTSEKTVDIISILSGHKKTRIALQPIYNLICNTIYGYEVLARWEGEDTSEIFRQAYEKNFILEIESLILEQIKKQISFINSKLFINVFPTLPEPSLWGELRHENVVLEITETASINYEAVKYLQKQGFLIALDDIGVGIRSLENLVKIQPNFIKIDKSLTQAENFKARDSLIKAFIDHSKRTEAQIIAEGIEKESHLEAIKKCGIILGQGYYLGKPELID